MAEVAIVVWVDGSVTVCVTVAGAVDMVVVEVELEVGAVTAELLEAVVLVCVETTAVVAVDETLTVVVLEVVSAVEVEEVEVDEVEDAVDATMLAEAWLNAWVESPTYSPSIT